MCSNNKSIMLYNLAEFCLDRISTQSIDTSAHSNRATVRLAILSTVLLSVYPRRCTHDVLVVMKYKSHDTDESRKHAHILQYHFGTGSTGVAHGGQKPSLREEAERRPGKQNSCRSRPTPSQMKTRMVKIM
jgi:hypothetical protein